MSIKKWLKKQKELLSGDATTDKTYSSEKKFSTVEEAKKEYKRSVEKLFDVNNWSNLPGISSEFILYDQQGKEKTLGLPHLNDFIKILLPGPFPENWVIITDIQQKETSSEFTVSPSKDPTEKPTAEHEIEHFFIDEATSTFKVALEGKYIKAWEIGKDEGINNDEEAGDRELLNSSIAAGGWIFVQKVQWEKLTDYLVHNIEIEDE